MEKLKRLAPALRTTHWPPLRRLPYWLLRGLPYGLPPRTTLNNSQIYVFGGKQHKKPTCSIYTIITGWKTAANFISPTSSTQSHYHFRPIFSLDTKLTTNQIAV